MTEQKDWRISATLDRLISNIPAVCKVLEEGGYVSLAGQLRRDNANLTYWQANGGLMAATFTIDGKHESELHRGMRNKQMS